MQTRKSVFILCLIAAFGISLPMPAQASNAAATAPKKEIQWIEILPGQKTTDPEAAKIAQILLKDDVKRFADPKTGFALAARFFNAPGLPKNSFIIAKFEGFAYCGTMGCMTYFLKMTDPKKNLWKIVHESNFSSIVTSEELVARQPSFYTRGTAESSYRRYNAAKGAYDTGL